MSFTFDSLPSSDGITLLGFLIQWVFLQLICCPERLNMDVHSEFSEF